MNTVSKPERVTQKRVVDLFRLELGYRYLGDRADRPNNSNIEEDLLTSYLAKAGYSPDQIRRAIYLLRVEADNPNRPLYDNNKAVYSTLRYGVPVKIEAGKVTESVKLIDWQSPENNDFVIVEEVTLRGNQERRPDLVLYLNGIAVAVIELKNSHTSIGDGIRQLNSNQQPAFNAWFFSTVQFVFAGNDSEGLRYGTIGTEEKLFLQWKEDEEDNSRFKLDKYLLKLCQKERLLELMYDFVLFDGGRKKLPRVHQYFGIKKAQAHVHASRGGILWHTQGSGKSIVMVLLARWILENKSDARVLIVTDRDELDKQIQGVFADAGEKMVRSSSGQDLMTQLGKKEARLLCSLVHKFGRKDVGNFDDFIQELKSQPSPAVGELFVFVDECHRSQTGKLHKTMKALLPSAVFIGFTGTPLLKEDKETSLEVFGGYIHTYKFGEAVQDKVVLDLVYEARDIEQRLGSQDKIDAWFEAKTQALNDWQKAALREQWGTMQKVLSSRSRMEQVVNDIVFDFSVTKLGKARLASGRGNAMLVASSIYEAARYFELFQRDALGFKGKCAIITSYNPQARDITREDTGANTETEKQFLYNIYTSLLKDVIPKGGKSKTETYEDDAKARFKEQPANMKLLIVVDKLLTGFDAPSCTFLYIDKSMQDHGLFQAICRTNRLDGDDKTYGYVVDYKDLFSKLVNDRGTGALQVYTSELDDSSGGPSPEVLMQDRLKVGRERLDQALNALALLCDPVKPPRSELEHIQYDCGNPELPEDLKKHEPQRVALYVSVAALARAYANIANELHRAGYTPAQLASIQGRVPDYVKLRETIRQASGETIDLKAYEADMRHLIDTYIVATEPRKISHFDNMGLLELIVTRGMADAISNLPEGIQRNPSAVAETIANNVRSKIMKEHLTDPAFYDKMSALLKEILEDLRAQRIDYEAFLAKMTAITKQLMAGRADDTPEPLKKSPGLRALYHALEQELQAKDTPEPEGPPQKANTVNASALDMALRVDEAIRLRKPDGWRGVLAKERMIMSIIHELVKEGKLVDRLFRILSEQGEYK